MLSLNGFKLDMILLCFAFSDQGSLYLQEKKLNKHESPKMNMADPKMQLPKLYYPSVFFFI